jgi:hypothetical protein
MAVAAGGSELLCNILSTAMGSLSVRWVDASRRGRVAYYCVEGYCTLYYCTRRGEWDASLSWLLFVVDDVIGRFVRGGEAEVAG